MAVSYDWVIGHTYIPKKPYYQVKEVTVTKVYYGNMKPATNAFMQITKDKEEYYNTTFKLVEYIYTDSVSGLERTDRMIWHKFFTIFTKKD